MKFKFFYSNRPSLLVRACSIFGAISLSSIAYSATETVFGYDPLLSSIVMCLGFLLCILVCIDLYLLGAYGNRQETHSEKKDV